MKIVVIDGQGGRMGSAFIDKWIKSGGDPKELIAVGTNAMATSAMMKAGAVIFLKVLLSSPCQLINMRTIEAVDTIDLNTRC